MASFAFVFPGQGSQVVGMLDAWGDHPVVRSTLEEASDALGEDLATLIREGPKERLDLTTHTQPAMLTTAIACYRAWRADGGAAPAAVAGHSLGEYTALVAADAIRLADALPLVRFRAEAMQNAVPVGTGAMAAILGLDDAEVKRICVDAAKACGEVVEAVNFNDPSQTVIAGTRVAVDMACERLRAGGAKRAMALAVSAPFHSTLMKPAADALRERLRSVPFVSPAVPVVNNVDVCAEADPEAIRDALYRQAFGPVRWVEVVRSLAARGVDRVVECGPGRVLGGTVRRTMPSIAVSHLSDPATLEATKGFLA